MGKVDKFELQALVRATKNFSHKLGHGGSAVVYLGELDDGTKVAVKRMTGLTAASTSEPMTGELKSRELKSYELEVLAAERLQKEMLKRFYSKTFESEVEVLSQLQHRHIISLLGCCTESNEKILVYEYMPHGDLEDHILRYRERKLPPLHWKGRLTIALDVARALEYLHNLANNRKYIHRDVKPANILLDENMRAKLADFGLVRATAEGENSVGTLMQSGTLGYCAPEFFETLDIAPAMDVYSFGAVLIVLVTGKGAKDVRGNLVTWFEKMSKSPDDFKKVVDPVLGGADLTFDSHMLQSVLEVAKLALYCTAQEPCSRPTMTSTVTALAALLLAWEITGTSVSVIARMFESANQLPPALGPGLSEVPDVSTARATGSMITRSRASVVIERIIFGTFSCLCFVVGSCCAGGTGSASAGGTGYGNAGGTGSASMGLLYGTSRFGDDDDDEKKKLLGHFPLAPHEPMFMQASAPFM